MPATHRVQIGIDENGLGPRLGPMVVTAVRIELDDKRIRSGRAFAKAAAAAGIGDSKAECGHGDMGDAEARVLAVLQQHLDLRPNSLHDIARAVGLEDDDALRRDCPNGEAPRACFEDIVPIPAFDRGPHQEHIAAADALLKAGIRLCGVRVAIVCAKRMNVARAKGVSRFDLDLNCMVRLIEALRPAEKQHPMIALCGKVGGRMRYSSAIEYLSPLVGILSEKRERSSYAVPGLGEIHFVMDGDATEPAIGLASMIGKYMRELWMHRLNRYWNAAVPGTVPVSGYHEPRTEHFVGLTALTRRERAIPDECFER